MAVKWTSRYEVAGGAMPGTDFVTIECKDCTDGLRYWDEKRHGKPTLEELYDTALLHESARHTGQ